MVPQGAAFRDPGGGGGGRVSASGTPPRVPLCSLTHPDSRPWAPLRAARSGTGRPSRGTKCAWRHFRSGNRTRSGSPAVPGVMKCEKLQISRAKDVPVNAPHTPQRASTDRHWRGGCVTPCTHGRCLPPPGPPFPWTPGGCLTWAVRSLSLGPRQSQMHRPRGPLVEGPRLPLTSHWGTQQMGDGQGACPRPQRASVRAWTVTPKDAHGGFLR